MLLKPICSFNNNKLEVLNKLSKKPNKQLTGLVEFLNKYENGTKLALKQNYMDDTVEIFNNKNLNPHQQPANNIKENSVRVPITSNIKNYKQAISKLVNNSESSSINKSNGIEPIAIDLNKVVSWVKEEDNLSQEVKNKIPVLNKYLTKYGWDYACNPDISIKQNNNNNTVEISRIKYNNMSEDFKRVATEIIPIDSSEEKYISAAEKVLQKADIIRTQESSNTNGFIKTLKLIYKNLTRKYD